MARDRPGSKLKTAGLATAGAGLAFLVTGTIFAIQARSASHEIDQLNAEGGVWTDSAQEAWVRGERAEAVSVIAFVVGGASVGTGAVLYFLGMRQEAEPRISVAPGRSAVTAVATWTF